MPESRARHGGRLPWQLTCLVGALVAIELLLWAADRGWVDAEWRRYAIVHGAFWRPLATGTATGMFEEQWLTMYVSHAFLHGGPFHVALNATVILAIGKQIAARTGAWTMLALFVLSAIAGAFGFQFLSSSDAPMIGASGAAFGFLGLWLHWDFRLRYRLGMSVTPVLKTVVGLIAANVLIYFAFSGNLAWEAHLGGFVAGIAAAEGLARFSAGRRAGHW